MYIVAVCFEKKRLPYLLHALEYFKMTIVGHVKVVIMISNNGNISIEYLKTKINQLTTFSKYDIYIYEDIYMDFSGYKTFFKKYTESSDVIFINDTISNKHRSKLLLRNFAEKINIISSLKFTAPVIAGPHSNSEYKFSKNSFSSFIPTYLFYLDEMGAKAFREILLNMNEKDLNNIYYQNFIAIHKISLLSNGVKKEYLNKKLICCIAERRLYENIYNTGLAYDTSSSTINKILIGIEKKIFIFLNKIQNILHLY